MTSPTVDPERRAYHREQRIAIESALRVAHIDQWSRTTRIWSEAEMDYLDTVMWLVATETFSRWQRIQREVHESGEPTERKLTDFAGGRA